MITLTNTTNEEIIVVNHLFRESGENDDSYQIPELQLVAWANDSEVIQKIADGSLLLNLNGTDISNVSEAVDVLKGVTPKKVESTNYPFAARILPNGKRTFRRVRGNSGVVQNSADNIDFVVPFTKCKILGLQVLNGKLGDKATFQVLDTSEGTISGIPYYILNTFGEDVYIEPGSAFYPSKYGADLIAGLTLRIVYNPVDELLPRTIYVNYDLHEIKD